MVPYIVIIVLLAVVFIVGFMDFRRKKNVGSLERNTGHRIGLGRRLESAGKYEMTVKFDDLLVLSEEEETRLVEVKGQQLLAKIDSVVPGTLLAVANTGVLKAYQEAAKNKGQLYQAIIPKGAVLDNSRAMEGAVRGSYRDVANSIKGNANWVAADNGAVNKLQAMNVVNAAMGVASMVVGQYYMTQINDQLEVISSSIEKLEDFQKNEFKSKVYALVAEVQKSSTFQIETMENDELRNRELQHLKSLEHECAQLLGQVNLSIRDITGKKSVEYDKYEKLIGEAELWFQYQHILLEVMYKISDLTYALNMGAISRENSYALYLPYAKQSDGALVKLTEWHKETADRLKISLVDSRRKRQGVQGFFMGALGLFNDDFNFKKISERTVALISHQEEGSVAIMPAEDDLYHEDVRLVAKEGKLYYLPSDSEVVVSA